MTWQELFYVSGSLLFIMWFLMLLVITVTGVLVGKKIIDAKEKLEIQVNDLHDQVSAKLKSPIAGMIPWLTILPTVLTLMKRFKKQR